MDKRFGNDKSSQKLRRVITKSIALMLKFVIPLYRTKRNRPELIGSGFFVQARGQTFLVSAAHVLDEVEKQNVFFYITTDQVRNLSGQLYQYFCTGCTITSERSRGCV